jgi:hypothetical protein
MIFMGVSVAGSPNQSLGLGLLGSLKRAAGNAPRESDIVAKDARELNHARMTLVLKHAETLYIEPIGKGIHRPYKVRLKTAEKCGYYDCSEVIFKTVHCQYETKRYCQSVDLQITGPERELLAYDVDKAMGFDLVPPTVGRHVDQLGYGSVMAWVRAPLAVDWVKNGRYRYKSHPENPWLHKLAAFDFITGQIDRHAANWILDNEYRVYAIDNGYSFVKNDDRRFLKCNVGKYLVGQRVNDEVVEMVKKIDDQKLWKSLKNRGFKLNEPEGVMKRLEEMRKLSVWGIMGGMWDPDKDKK